MATLKVWKAFEMDLATDPVRGGSRSSPIEIEVSGLKIDKEFSLATSTTIDIWTSADAVTNFDYVWLEADQDLRIEWTCDRGGEVGTVVFADLMEALTPWDRFYDDAMANYTANYATGTADVVDRIRLRNVSGSTAYGRFVLIT
jgi:hypothetical protein